MKKAKKEGSNNYLEVDSDKEKEKQKLAGKILDEKWEEFVRKNKKAKDDMAKGKAAKSKKPGEAGVSGEKGAAKKTDGQEKPSGENAEEPEDDGEAEHKKSDSREFLETDVDKLYELTREKGIIKVKDAAKILKIDAEQVEEWGRILEEHKLVRLRYPPVGDPVLILKRFTSDTEKIKSLKKRKKIRPRKRVFIINIIIIAFFALFISFYTIRFQVIRITYTQAYLAAAVIIIIGIIFVLRFVKKRGKNGKGGGEKGDKKTQHI